MIEESVAFLVAQGKRVVYDAEHCFDGWRDDRDYALRCLRAAAEAGAETVVPCDTNGASLPGQIAEAIARRGRARSPTRACASASTATTTSSAASPTRSPPSRPARRTCRAR